MGVFYAAVKASPKMNLNIDIGGRGGETLTSRSEMGVFYADTGTPLNLRGPALHAYCDARWTNPYKHTCTPTRKSTCFLIPARVHTHKVKLTMPPELKPPSADPNFGLAACRKQAHATMDPDSLYGPSLQDLSFMTATTPPKRTPRPTGT